MGRPRLTTATSRASYSDIVPLWEKALQLNGLQLTFETESKAISKVYRLNSWRVQCRKTGDFSLDRFVIRRRDATIRIEEREGLGNVVVETLEGIPVEVISDDDKLQPSKEEQAVILEGFSEGKEDYEVLRKVNIWRMHQGLRPREMDELFPKTGMTL
jgi:hypothetical protein